MILNLMHDQPEMTPKVNDEGASSCVCSLFVASLLLAARAATHGCHTNR